MKKFLVFICVLFLMVGYAIPAIAVDGEDGGDIALAMNDEIIPDEEPNEEEEPILYPITVSYNFWYSESDRSVVYSTSGNTQYAKEGEFFYVNGYTPSYAFTATIPGFETMTWKIKSVYTVGANTDGLEACSGVMGTSPINIQFYYVPYEDTVYVEHYCDDVFVETTSYTAQVGRQTYAMLNSYEGYTLVNELVGDIVPIRATGVAPLTLRLDYHSPNYQPSEPTPEPEEPTPSPEPVEDEEPVIPPVAGETEEKENPTPTPTPTATPTTTAIPVYNAPIEVVAPQEANTTPAGWSIVSLFLALGCLGFGYALFKENKMRYDGIVIGVLAFMIFIMSVQSWATMIIADTTTWLMTGIFIINMLNYWLQNKEIKL